MLGRVKREVKKEKITCSFLSIGEFDNVEEEWNALNMITAQLPIMDAAFVRLLLHYFGSGKEVLVRCRKEDRTVAIGILVKIRPGVWQTFQPSQAPLGIWLQDSALAFSETMKAVQDLAGQRCLVLGITQQDPDIVARPNQAKHIRTLDYINTARITVKEPFEEYWVSRGKNLKHNLTRQRNRLEREGICTRLEKIDTPGAMVGAVQDYGNLESKGWKEKQGTALDSNNPQGQFYAECLKQFATVGEAMAYRYWYQNKLVATDLCLVRNGTLVILKTTYDEEQKKTSPAMLMRQESFREIFNSGRFKRIEFYGRAMDWHLKWTNEIKCMYHLNYYRWGWLTTFAAGESVRATKA